MPDRQIKSDKADLFLPRHPGRPQGAPGTSRGVGMDQHYWLYIMTNKQNGTLYVGTTKNLIQRVVAHREDRGAGFVKKHQLKRLVYYCEYPDYMQAREEEARIKKWRRVWKLQLIEAMNPNWQDLYPDLNK